jgi:hypothetical protein
MLPQVSLLLPGLETSRRSRLRRLPLSFFHLDDDRYPSEWLQPVVSIHSGHFQELTDIPGVHCMTVSLGT